MSTLRVIIEKEDETIMVDGKDAQVWGTAVEGQAVFCHVHGMKFPDLNWKHLDKEKFIPVSVIKNLIAEMGDAAQMFEDEASRIGMRAMLVEGNNRIRMEAESRAMHSIMNVYKCLIIALNNRIPEVKGE